MPKICILQPSCDRTIMIARYDNRLALIRRMLVHKTYRILNLSAYTFDPIFPLCEFGDPVVLMMVVARMKINRVMPKEIARIDHLHETIWCGKSCLDHIRQDPPLVYITHRDRQSGLRGACPLGSEFHIKINKTPLLGRIQLTDVKNIINVDLDD